jgi:hypothetical protein
MSVREQLFVQIDGSPAELADLTAKLIGGRAELRNQQPWLLVDTARLVPGVDPATGADAGIFRALAASADFALIHVHDDDFLRHAVLPGTEAVAFPPGVTIYDWDQDKWRDVVLVPGGR